MPRIARYDEEFLSDESYRLTHRPRRANPARAELEAEARRDPKPRHHDLRAVREGRESFKCGHCRAFIGPTISGGKHRNHCPLCLHSRHVDARQPGDRACACRALMAPVGLVIRRNGEQAILHRCLGCGVERVCRVAADDNPLAVMRLPLAAHPAAQPAASDDAGEAALA